MLTPRDIQEREFSKAFRGYHPQAVRGFLEGVAGAYRQLLEENYQLKETLKDLAFELRCFRHLDESLNNTLEVARASVSQVTEVAHQEAGLILGKARPQAEAERSEGTRVAGKIESEAARMEVSASQFRRRVRDDLMRVLSALEKVKA
ncbi:MAG: DivIVA domain-containing protein [Bacillota bacterium]|jgi:cell division initiation protein